MERTVFSLGSLLAAVGVAFGAFGAHFLKGRIAADLLAIFETGVRYQLIHALALLAMSWAISRWPERGLTNPAWMLFAGTLVFSGSLELLAVTGLRWLGAVTPIGGLLLIAGWVLAAWRVSRPV
jgi:uncharacterized membrane protein YgdD (TMEM256/DUF423 family)